MKKLRSVVLIYAVVMSLSCVSSRADEKPIQLALITPVQIVSEEHSITAFRFNLIYGRNVSVTGLDIGFINQMTQGTSKGVQFGFFGMVDMDFVGWQYNTFNVTKLDFVGFQLGLFNYAGNAKGLQLGFFNYSRTMHGLQIGLINVISEGALLPIFPIVNWSF